MADFQEVLKLGKWPHLPNPCGHKFSLREPKIGKIIAHSCGFATVLSDFLNHFK
jgi:hypothetical protein